jgi:hypothetical protein
MSYNLCLLPRKLIAAALERNHSQYQQVAINGGNVIGVTANRLSEKMMALGLAWRRGGIDENPISVSQGNLNWAAHKHRSRCDRHFGSVGACAYEGFRF